MTFRELAENLEMEVDEFLEMLKLFLETTVLDLNQWQSGLDERNSEKVIMSAHSIKGAAVNLGLMEIYEVAKEMEREARKDHLDATDRGIVILREKVAQMAESLKLGEQKARDR